MFNSLMIADEPVAEHPPKSSLPWVWFGFVFVLAFFIVEVLWAVMQLEEAGINAGLTLIAVAGWIYWLFCVHRLHKILAEMTGNRYPITPGEAAGKHIIPIYNLYWVFKWPAELSTYLNRRGRTGIVSGYLIGGLLLVALLLRFFDGALGMALLFGTTLYVSQKVKRHIEIVKGVPADKLPPLPDPEVFQRPHETTTNLAQERTESS